MSKKRLIRRAPSTLLAFSLACGAMLSTVLQPITSFAAPGDVRKRDHGPPTDNKQAESLFESALSKAETDEPAVVRPLFAQALQLWIASRASERAAQAALKIGDCYFAATKFPESLYYYKQVLELNDLPRSTRARASNSIARSYLDLYESELALRYYNQGLTEASAISDLSIQAVALTGIAGAYYQQRENQKARKFIREARQLQRGLDPKIDAALAEIAGRILLDEGSFKPAHKSFETVLAIHQRGGDIKGQVIALCLLADAELASGEIAAALQHSNQARNLADDQVPRAKLNSEKTRARLLRFNAYLALARVLRATGDRNAAQAKYQFARSQVVALWWLCYAATDRSATGFAADYQAACNEHIDILIEQGRIVDAFEELQRARGKTIQALITARRLREASRRHEESATVRKYSSAVSQLRTRLFSSKLTAQQRAKIDHEFREAEMAREEARIASDSENSTKQFQSYQPIDLASLKNYLKANDESLVEFMLGEKRSFAWFISPTGPTLITLPGRAYIEKQVKEFLSLISSRPANNEIDEPIRNVKIHGSDLFKMLFGDLSKQLPAARNLIIVPDGILHNVPFDALVQNDRYLLEDHRISYLISAGMISLLQDGRTGEDRRMDFIGFADPLFAPEDESSNRNRTVKASDNPIRAIISIDRNSVPRLKRTRDEVQDIAKQFPGRCRIYLGADATEEALKKENLSLFKRIHIATHNLVDTESVFHSMVLLLTLDDNTDEDGFLEMSEVSELNLDCDLVVLSACQTGGGQLVEGEGIVGLSRAFLYAGARSVAVSLWNITDTSTADLMKNFYQELSQNIGNAEALRDAKLKSLKGRAETRHPYYWAPFIITGRP